MRAAARLSLATKPAASVAAATNACASPCDRDRFVGYRARGVTSPMDVAQGLTCLLLHRVADDLGGYRRRPRWIPQTRRPVPQIRPAIADAPALPVTGSTKPPPLSC